MSWLFDNLYYISVHYKNIAYYIHVYPTYGDYIYAYHTFGDCMVLTCMKPAVSTLHFRELYL